MGDLSMTLTLKSRIEDETKKIIRELNKVDSTGKQAQNALEAISEATKGIGDKGGRSFEKLNNFVKELRRNIGIFSSEDFFSSKKLQQLESVQDGLYKIGRILGEVSKEGAGFSIFPNSVATEANKAKRELHKLSSFIDEINKRHGEGVQLFGVDSTNNIRQSLSELSKYRTELEQIRNNGGIHPITGLTASDVVKSAGFLNAIDDAKMYAKEVKNSIKEVEKAREDAKKKADAAIENQKKLDNGETAYYAKIRDILQQIDTLSKGMTPFLNATANRGMTFPAHLVDDLKKLYSVQQTLLANNHAGRNMGLDWLKDIQNRNGFSIITKELKDFIANAEEARKRYVRLFDVLNELRNTRAVANIAGVDTSKIDSQIASTLAALKELRTIMQTGIGDAKGVIGSDSRSVTLAGRVNKEVRDGIRLEQKRQQEIAQTGAKIQSDLVRGFEKANSHAGKLNSTVQDLKSLFLQGGLVFGAQQFAMNIITTGGEMEKQHIALQSILGDMQNANTMFNQIKELALNSPFTFSELNRDVKQLAAYGVEYDQLYDTTKRLADMSSGLGVSFDRIALAFGQVQARGWLDGKELRQIAYAGIPLLEKLSEFYSKQEGRNVSTSEIKTRISSRDVSFDDVKSIFWQMTDAGGQFYNMQQVLSETLLGRYNKLKDAWEIMLADFANGKNVIGGTFKGILDVVTNLVQQIHVLGPAMVAAFAGPALMRGVKTLEGGIGKRILNSKGNIAKEAELKLLRGEKITPVEKQILQYKNQIRIQDIQALAKANAITKAELRRLYVTGQITKEMYKQGMALTKQEGQVNRISLGGVLKGLASPSKWGAAGGLLLGGLKSGFSSIIGFLGGLPGIAISAGSAIFAYYWQKHQQLKQDMETTADELKDRYTKISEFLRDNDADKAIKDGDEKEIENLIDAYKEKLKEIAPEKENAFTMSLLEKKSNEDRLKYLKEQLELLKQVEQETKKRLSNEDTYSDFDDDLSKAKSVAEEYAKASAKTNMINATQADFSAFNAWSVKYEDEIKNMRNRITEELGDISKDPKLQGQANQILSSFFAKQGWDQDVSDQFRADVLNAMGVETGFYEDKFKSALDNAVSTSFPWIGDKIRNNQELTDAERTQVANMMKDAAAQIQKDYPKASDTLKRMLAADRFEAVIHLVFDTEETDLVKQAGSNTKMSDGDGYAYHRRNKLSKQIAEGAGNSRYKFRQDYSDKVSSAKKEYEETKSELNKGLTTLDAYTAALQNYNDLKKGFREQFGIDWVDTSNKNGGRKSTGAKRDKALEDLKKRIDLYKKMYAEIKKFKELYGEGALGQLANDGEFESIFGDKKRFPISDYTNYETSIKELLKTLPASTKDRLDYAANEKAGIQTENRKLLEDQRRDELNVLNKQLDTISEQYETYKKIYELTGNKKGAQNIAFGGIVQFDTYKKFLEEQLDIAVRHDNIQSGLNLTTDEVKDMSLENVKDKYGEETRVYDIRKKLEDENNKIKKETIDLMASLIENNATIAQQIEDENRKYERQLELVKGIEDPQMRERASEGATKTHNENLAKLQFEQFKQESDWVAIFDDLDRVSSATINTMISNIDEFSRTTGLSIEVVKQLRDALDKLRNEQIDRNPLPSIFGGVRRGNAIGEILKGNRKIGASGINISDAQAKKTGLIAGKWYSNADLENSKKGAYNDSSKAITSLSGKMQALSNIMDPVINLFEALGEQNSILGQIAGGASNAFGAAANVSGGLSALGLGAAGPYGAAAAAALSVGSSLIKAFGADYSSYNKAKAEYDNLTSIWDSLISKKTEYMNIHWGTEATEASKEAQEMLKAEIEQTKVIAQKRLNAGASAGSHSIKYRMWKGSYKYNGQNWRDVAGDISSKYGVQFNGMEDMLNMNADTLSKIKKDYTGLWANMDSEFRDYLEKLIQYGEKADDMIEAVTEKLTGNKFSDLVSSWGDAMATMENSSDNLVEHFEDNLKKTILNSMIENLYGDKIKAILAKAKKYGDSKESEDWIVDGKYMGAYTPQENAEIKSDVEEVAKEIEATRDFFKKEYGWSDNSSSSSRNSVKGITEETGDLIASYLNSIRLYCAEDNTNLKQLTELTKSALPEMSEIAKSQLTQLNAIARNTLRNADAAERIESIFTEYNDNFNRVLNGTKSLKMK